MKREFNGKRGDEKGKERGCKVERGKGGGKGEK